MKLEYQTEDNGSVLILRGAAKATTGVIVKMVSHYVALDCTLRTAEELRAIADKLDELDELNGVKS